MDSGSLGNSCFSSAPNRSSLNSQTNMTAQQYNPQFPQGVSFSQSRTRSCFTPNWNPTNIGTASVSSNASAATSAGSASNDDHQFLGHGSVASAHDIPLTETDRMLAKEMNELSVQERNRVYEQVHGVANETEETPDLLKAKLTEMDYELKQVQQRSAYERAMFMSPSFIQARNYKLLFLRTEQYDTRKAAERLVRHFQFKLELFGLEKLVKKITLQDIGDGGMDYLKTGALTKLPNRDRKGRICYAACQKYQRYDTWQDLFRATCYFLEAMAEDDLSQKIGTVLILYNVGFDVLRDSMLDRQVMTITTKMVDATPIRNTAVHYCYNDPKLLPALAVAQLALGRNNRLRFRTHYGSHTECQYSLMTFGISADGLPVDSHGNRDITRTFAWLQERHLLEMQEQEQKRQQQQREGAEAIEYPHPNDVLLGRGRPFQEWPGNKRLSEWIDQYYPVFSESDRSTKTSISKGIVQMVKAAGGRFLKRGDDNDWVLVSDYDGREKVSHAFRNRKQRDAERGQPRRNGGNPLSAIPDNLGSNSDPGDAEMVY